MTSNSRQTEWRITNTGPEAYERYIVPAWMGEWAGDLVQTGGVRPGKRVLDVACGTGVVAREALKAAGAGIDVTGVDMDEGMLRAAERFAARDGLGAIDWRRGEATRIPADPATYDIVFCQQGLQFFPDRPAALREMARVMRPGGRLALSVWRSLDRSPFLAVLADILGRRFGAGAAAVFHASCALTDRESLRTLVRDAGFHDIHIRIEAKVARYPSLTDFLPGYLAVFPIATAIAAMNDAARAELFEQMVTSLASYVDDDGLAAPMESHVLTASL
ncbi:methyltransferase domain-containing protein [Telmatospirillum sp.]|uniref:class I SAM-dependent methyltransferase n=1 Tax=Telmatospirillum sp. TaxID=2079197 RepID=UPI002848737C|nr:methyltransferase domain-containing protein [Telmatospirillum sp.]MDR3436773.1 class I SAM-dependent methyltransferase [Telmatospirillum sp.]